MILLENENLLVQIDPHGAELKSVIDKKTNYEFMWQGDDKYWNRTAPNLFPIVGNLKNGEYTHEGKTYKMGRHGFARDMDFKVQVVTENMASLYLKNTEETMKIYPFEFGFQITYILHDNSLTVTFEVLNPSRDKELYFSAGAHPAFNVSRVDKGHRMELDNVYLDVVPEGLYLKRLVNEDGLISTEKRTKYNFVDREPVLYKDFRGDTLIYQIHNKTKMTLVDKPNNVEIEMDPHGMSFMALWTPYQLQAPFISMEAWVGISDLDNTTGEFSEKYAINSVDPGSVYTHDYTLTFRKKEEKDTKKD